MIFKWFWARFFVHGWWKRHPKEWVEIVKTKDKLTQKFIHWDRLVEENAKRGQPIHSIKCKICKEQWYTTCKLDLCKKLSCWLAYGR